MVDIILSAKEFAYPIARLKYVNRPPGVHLHLQNAYHTSFAAHQNLYQQSAITKENSAKSTSS